MPFSVAYDPECHRALSRGLAEMNNYEIAVSVQDATYCKDAGRLVEELGRYIEATGHQIQPNQTVTWATWLLKFELSQSGELESLEADIASQDFVPGADKTISIWNQQSKVLTGSP